MMNTQYGTRYRLDINGMFAVYQQDLIVEPTSNTPFVKYSRSENVFMIKGNSMGMDIDHFYYSLIERAKGHVKVGLPLDVIFFYNILNPTTAKVLFDFFKFVRDKKRAGAIIDVTWCAEGNNEDMIQTGKDFAEIYDLNFKFVTI